MHALLLTLSLSVPTTGSASDYSADMEFALDTLEENCGHFFEVKDIDWRDVRKEMTKAAKKVKTDEEHYHLMWRLLARLEDGHASVRTTAKTEGIRWDDGQGERTGAGLFLCRIDGDVFVKNAYSSAKEIGLASGQEVLKIDGSDPNKWLEARVEELSDVWSFSTDHQAMFYACHWGLSMPIGTRLKLEVKDEKGKKKKKTLTYSKANSTPWGPAFYPEDTTFGKNVHHAKLSEGYGYIQVRRCKSSLPEEIDEALKALGNVPGLILDFRGNSGGGFDHDAVLGRFVPEGRQLEFAKRIPSAGPAQYGGPVVVIIDATCRSAGETGAGMFKEDGRAYMIGESNTAGMSSSKKTIPLPSGLFELYVSVASNKGRFNEGRGIEGIGVVPNEYVEFDQEDLFAEKDTLIRIAAERLAKFPQEDVWYDPADFGWEAGE